MAYPFSFDFQLRLLALPIFDRDFLRHYRHVFVPTYFGSTTAQTFATVVLDFFQNHHVSPSRDLLFDLVVDSTRRDQRQPATDDDVRAFIARVVAVPISDLEYVKQKTVEWAQAQAIAEAAVGLAEIHERSVRTGSTDINEARAVMRTALTVGTADRRYDVLDYFDDLVPRLYRDPNLFKIPTGFRTLDAALKGGLDRGELGVFIGAPSMGKSSMLVGVARGALIHRQRTFVVTNEISKERWALRLDVAITKKSHEELAADPRSAIRHIRRMRQVKGDLKILSLPSGFGTIDDIEASLEQLKEDNFVPEIIIIDYADELTVKTRAADDLRLRAIEVYRALRALAQKRQIPIWTATQANRSAVDREIVTIQHLAEAFAKAGISDVMIAICQTPEEAATQPYPSCRLFGAKNREGKRYFVLPYYFMPQRGILVPNDDAMPTTYLGDGGGGTPQPSAGAPVEEETTVYAQT